MFERCFRAGEFKHATGIALESRRLDIIRDIIQRIDDPSDILAFCFSRCHSTVMTREWRQQVLAQLLVREVP